MRRWWWTFLCDTGMCVQRRPQSGRHRRRMAGGDRPASRQPVQPNPLKQVFAAIRSATESWFSNKNPIFVFLGTPPPARVRCSNPDCIGVSPKPPRIETMPGPKQVIRWKCAWHYPLLFHGSGMWMTDLGPLRWGAGVSIRLLPKETKTLEIFPLCVSFVVISLWHKNSIAVIVYIL